MAGINPNLGIQNLQLTSTVSINKTNGEKKQTGEARISAVYQVPWGPDEDNNVRMGGSKGVTVGDKIIANGRIYEVVSIKSDAQFISCEVKESIITTEDLDRNRGDIRK